jgi:benzoate membrane transport protein
MEESIKASGAASLARDFNAAALWAGLTTFIWFASGMVPLQIAVSRQLGLDAAQSSSWIFIVWLSAAVSSIALSLTYRQPIPITWTIPGLVYMGTLAGDFTFSELAGANLMAGLLMVALGIADIGGRIM